MKFKLVLFLIIKFSYAVNEGGNGSTETKSYADACKGGVKENKDSVNSGKEDGTEDDSSNENPFDRNDKKRRSVIKNEEQKETVDDQVDVTHKVINENKPPSNEGTEETVPNEVNDESEELREDTFETNKFTSSEGPEEIVFDQVDGSHNDNPEAHEPPSSERFDEIVSDGNVPDDKRQELREGQKGAHKTPSSEGSEETVHDQVDGSLNVSPEANELHNNSTILPDSQEVLVAENEHPEEIGENESIGRKSPEKSSENESSDDSSTTTSSFEEIKALGNEADHIVDTQKSNIGDNNTTDKEESLGVKEEQQVNKEESVEHDEGRASSSHTEKGTSDVKIPLISAEPSEREKVIEENDGTTEDLSKKKEIISTLSPSKDDDYYDNPSLAVNNDSSLIIINKDPSFNDTEGSSPNQTSTGGKAAPTENENNLNGKYSNKVSESLTNSNEESKDTGDDKKATNNYSSLNAVTEPSTDNNEEFKSVNDNKDLNTEINNLLNIEVESLFSDTKDIRANTIDKKDNTPDLSSLNSTTSTKDTESKSKDEEDNTVNEPPLKIDIKPPTNNTNKDSPATKDIDVKDPSLNFNTENVMNSAPSTKDVKTASKNFLNVESNPFIFPTNINNKEDNTENHPSFNIENDSFLISDIKDPFNKKEDNTPNPFSFDTRPFTIQPTSSHFIKDVKKVSKDFLNAETNPFKLPVNDIKINERKDNASNHSSLVNITESFTLPINNDLIFKDTSNKGGLNLINYENLINNNLFEENIPQNLNDLNNVNTNFIELEGATGFTSPKIINQNLNDFNAKLIETERLNSIREDKITRKEDTNKEDSITNKEDSINIEFIERDTTPPPPVNDNTHTLINNQNLNENQLNNNLENEFRNQPSTSSTYNENLERDSTPSNNHSNVNNQNSGNMNFLGNNRPQPSRPAPIRLKFTVNRN